MKSLNGKIAAHKTSIENLKKANAELKEKNRSHQEHMEELEKEFKAEVKRIQELE